MAIYPKKKYEEEIDRLKETCWTMSFANILQIQQFARGISMAEPPAMIKQRRLLAPPEPDVVHALHMAINGLGQPSDHLSLPLLADVHTEWVTCAEAVTDDSPVLFFVHGGGFLYGSPGTARRITRRLAQLVKGSCVAIQYRYATEHPFPGSLLDVLVAYLALMTPLNNTKAQVVSSKQIVLTGESSGFNLIMSLVQVLLYLRVHKPTIRFHGRDVKVELPAGVAGLCGFMDITCGLPSWHNNSRWDVLPEFQPTYDRKQWHDQELWPTEPARADVYCDKPSMTHPLVSPVAAASWKGCPPLFIACGEERNTDGNLYIAKQAAAQEVSVDLRVYEHMTHVWATGLPHLPHSAHVLESWAARCQTMVRKQSFPTQMSVISFDTLESSERDIKSCTRLTREDVLGMMATSQQAREVVHRNTTAPKL